jgi:RNA polymerase sigma-70 factor (sigma-E family)
VTEVDDDFTAFVRATGDRSLRLAVLLAGDVAGGQDLLQSVHEQVYRHWRRHGSPVAPERYVRTALANAASKSRLHYARRRETLVAEPPDRHGYEVGADVLLRTRLLPALKRLSPRQRSVVVLRYFGDHTESETAELLGCSVGTVKTQASRALARLREDPSLRDALSTMEA